MPTLHAVEATILTQVQAALNGVQALYGNPAVLTNINVKSGIGWPSTQMLQANVKNANAVVGIYDCKVARNTTRWLPSLYALAVTQAGISSSVSGNGNLTLNSPVVITITGTVVSGDAISAVFNYPAGAIPASGLLTNYSPVWGTVVDSAPGDTIDTLATKLAAAINADSILSTWVSASASDNQVTIASLTEFPEFLLNVRSFTGNGAQRTTEVGRKSRLFQIVTWSPTEEIREAIGDPIEGMIADAEINFGLAFADGSVGRLQFQNDFDLEDATLQDTYRRDFRFTIEYGITVQDALYSVLAPIPQYQIN